MFPPTQNANLKELLDPIEYIMVDCTNVVFVAATATVLCV